MLTSATSTFYSQPPSFIDHLDFLIILHYPSLFLLFLFLKSYLSLLCRALQRKGQKLWNNWHIPVQINLLSLCPIRVSTFSHSLLQSVVCPGHQHTCPISALLGLCTNICLVCPLPAFRSFIFLLFNINVFPDI